MTSNPESVANAWCMPYLYNYFYPYIQEFVTTTHGNQKEIELEYWNLSHSKLGSKRTIDRKKINNDYTLSDIANKIKKCIAYYDNSAMPLRYIMSKYRFNWGDFPQIDYPSLQQIFKAGNIYVTMSAKGFLLLTKDKVLCIFCVCVSLGCVILFYFLFLCLCSCCGVFGV